jgi:hypothetical protein
MFEEIFIDKIKYYYQNIYELSKSKINYKVEMLQFKINEDIYNLLDPIDKIKYERIDEKIDERTDKYYQILDEYYQEPFMHIKHYLPQTISKYIWDKFKLNDTYINYYELELIKSDNIYMLKNSGPEFFPFNINFVLPEHVSDNETMKNYLIKSNYLKYYQHIFNSYRLNIKYLLDLKNI